jgi:hypothetical protein
MDRVRLGGYGEVIEAAYALFLCGTDPVFAGLHGYINGADGRPYAETPHVAHDFHQTGLSRARRHTTVVLPKVPAIATVVHELGHVLDEALNFEHVAEPVSSYARNSRHEAFAEAFAAWVLPFGHGYGAAKDALHETDPATVALLSALTDRRTP